LVAAVVTTVFAPFATQNNHIGSDNFSRISLLTVTVGVFTRLQTPFDIDTGAFGQVLVADFGQLLPCHHPEPLGIVVLRAVS
jgi:hypothetical protein